MSRKYHGIFKSFNNDEYTVELWDGAANVGTGSTEMVLADSGFKLEYSGENDTIYENHLRSSRATAYFLIEDGVTETYFMDIATQPENKFALQILKNGALWWVGRVLGDQMQFTRSAYEGKYVCEITAVDALELISNFKVSSAWFSSGYSTPMNIIVESLELTGLQEYYQSTYANSSGIMYWDCIEHTNPNMSLTNGSPLIRTRIREYSFADNPNEEIWDVIDYVDCRKGIQQILSTFGARMMLRDGRYTIYQPNAYDGATITYKTIDYAGFYVGSGTFTHAHTLDLANRKQWEAKPVKRYQKPVRKVEIGFTRNHIFYASKSTFNTTSSSAVDTFIDDTKALKYFIQVELEPSSSSYNYIHVNYGYYAKVSGVYYYWNWIAQAWTNLSPATAYNRTKTIYTQPLFFLNPTIKVIDEFDFLPTNCDEFGVTVNSVVGRNFGGGAGTGTSLNFKSRIFIQQPYINDSPREYQIKLSYEAENGAVSASGNSGYVELISPYYSGTQEGVFSLQTFNGSNYVAPDAWSVGWTANTGDLPQVLARLICGYYVNFVPTIRGVWIDNGDYEPLKSLSFDSYTWLFNAAKFDPRFDVWEGEWVGLIADYDLVTDNGEGQRVWGTENDDIYDRLNYLETTISRHESAFAQGINLNGTITGNLTINETTGNLLYLLDSTGGAIIVTLPTAVDNTAVMTFKKISSDSNNVTIDGDGTETIDGATTKILATQYQFYTIAASGGNWHIIAR